ncbi:MAG: AAA family ATPase [Deltaproteobacteria bacterium]|nr:AAA family ATPase [Deltaproteobacteria bacterium]
MSENSVIQQILSNDRNGIRSFDENLIKGLAEYDPIEYARRKPVAANELGVSQFDLDQLVKKVSQFPTLDKETGKPIQSIEIRDFLAREFAERIFLLNPWLPSQGLVMVFAPRGIGKTFFSLGVAYAVSSGGRFLRWQAPNPQGVLFIDGEMPGVVLQERLARLALSCAEEPQAPLRIITPDLQEKGMIDLAKSKDQAELSNHLKMFH